MRSATFAIVVAFLYNTGTAAPLITYESPCECLRRRPLANKEVEDLARHYEKQMHD